MTNAYIIEVIIEVTSSSKPYNPDRLLTSIKTAIEKSVHGEPGVTLKVRS